MRVIGTIFRHLGSIGVVSGINPIGTVKFLYGNEMNQKTIDVKLKNLKPVDLTDLTKEEYEAVLPLMQRVVFNLVDDMEIF